DHLNQQVSGSHLGTHTLTFFDTQTSRAFHRLDRAFDRSRRELFFNGIPTIQRHFNSYCLDKRASPRRSSSSLAHTTPLPADEPLSADLCHAAVASSRFSVTILIKSLSSTTLTSSARAMNRL